MGGILAAKKVRSELIPRKPQDVVSIASKASDVVSTKKKITKTVTNQGKSRLAIATKSGTKSGVSRDIT